ncbi:MAG: hypothetical protein JWO36_6955, partial [Myxococcales bacterium]|nr:hypothetical protein [Myxococcales bacterium]
VPSLWVIRKNGLAVIDRLLDYLPEEIVARLTFAATTGPESPSGDSAAASPSGDSEAASPSGDSEAAPQIILRARTGRHPPPDLSLGGDAEEYAPLAQMPDLYAPAGAIVEPPLRRERLRAIVGVDHGQVVWLARTTETKFRVERMPDSAFLPLAEWADYVIHTSAAALVPWTRASIFEFTEFVSNGLEWASGPPEEPAAEVDPKKMKKPGRTRSVQTELEAPLQSPRPTAPQPPSKTKEVGTTPVAEVAIDQELVALESEFVALDAPGDAPERLELFDKLGHAYARLARNRDAGLCFVRSVWESSGADATARLDTWIAADPRRAPAARALDHALAQTVPSNDEVRTVAMLAARAGAAIAKDPHRVHRWLDDHDIELDARTLWLARLGLASLAGGDALGLAHARDRILARLASGLPVERELPAFLRFAGRSGALGNASGEHLASALDELARKFEKTRRKRSVLEAPVAFTNAYVGYQLAYGFARIGKHERARALVAESHRALKAVENDVVHGYLMAAYASRVEQAIAGLAPETPLAGELAARLAKLAPLMRYTIDRLREGSRILEPVERPDAFGGFIRSHKDSRGPEFEALRTITDLVARAKAVDRLVGLAAKTEPDRERLIDGIFDVLLELPESAAVPILLRTWPLIEQLAEPRRAVLYAEALVVAGHFGRTELVRELLEVLGTAIRSVTGADLERVLQQSLRALRRIGLRHEIAELLAEAEHALPATNAVDALRGRLALAAGLAFLGDSARALPIFDQARKMLGETGMIATARLDLTRALALAYAQAPLSNALGGIAELAGQLRDVTDNYGTNSHYCLSVLHFVESLVLGITSDDLALGEAGRRFIEDDEHLIRRRLHRDLGGPS